ncbi:MAG: HD domain-containing protein, partial [Thermoanaerobacterales bacterium]|nr:HD domain-containing protein [Thermoanaerobacterales bacterium]
MISIEEIKNDLKNRLTHERYTHSLNVMHTASILATRYGVDKKKAELAGLIHDCARDLPADIQLKMATDFGILLDEIEKLQPELVHGPLGAFIARKQYGIDDDEVIRAVTIHSTGDKFMTSFDKILFIADYVEPGRCFPSVESIRKKLARDLDEALLSAFS